MAVFKCKMCGAPLNIEGNETVIKCEYCQQPQTLPKLNDEKRVQMYDRANHFRRNNEFDKAAAIYEQILLEDNTDAETYWSLVLCRYGIEYVEDPATGKRVPTVNRAQFTSIYDDDNYRSAIEYADVMQRSLYEEEAKTINEIQKGILAISQKEEPFDIFICYKETGTDGRRTPDSVLATELYQQLTREGFKVFFSRITLESKLGTAYEPYIFAALNSAKVMVVIGTKPEYFNAVWVKNEWSRYLSLIKNGAEKLLIPAYRDMDPYDLPDEFSHLQAQDMGKLGFMQDLTYGITKIVRPKTAQQTVVVESAQSNNSNVTALLKRAFMFLEDKDWHSASEYCEKVLDIEPENAEAYLAKLMVEQKVNVREQLNTCDQPFNSSSNYIKVVRFGSPALKEELDGYNREITERNNDIAYKKAISLMEQADTEARYKKAAEIFREMSDYRDSKSLEKQCLECAEVCRKDKVYSDSKVAMSKQKVSSYDTAIAGFRSISGWLDADEQAENCEKRKQALVKNAVYEAANEFMQKDTNNSYQSAIEKFREIPGWRDADELIKICERRIEENNAKAEAERIAKEKAEEKERKAKKRKKNARRIWKATVAVAVVLCIAVGIMIPVYIIPNSKYTQAMGYIEDEAYLDAYKLFIEIDDFKDSAEQIKTAYNGYVKNIVSSAEIGDIIYFGKYEQDNKSLNGDELIEWQILKKEDGKVLLLSKYALDSVMYYPQMQDITWEESNIRYFLNNSFVDRAFLEFEKDMILTTDVPAHSVFDTDPGNETQDKVFLLSRSEVNELFPEEEDRICYATAYAEDSGANLHYSTNATCWYLRSPSYYQHSADAVDYDGGFASYGITVNSDEAIRPALWLKID